MADVFWRGQKLPPLREGNVWLMQIYPGGRTIVVQHKSHYAMYVGHAVSRLLDGHMVFVWLDDAEETIRQWNARKAE